MASNVMERCCASGAGIAAEKAAEAAQAAQDAAKNVANAVDLAAEAVAIARNAERILDMETAAHALDTDEPPTVSYDKVANVMDFGLPKGNTGDEGPVGPPPDFLGTVDDKDRLPEVGCHGAGWFLPNGDLYYWNRDAIVWTLAANLKGPMGASIKIKGTKETADDLPETAEPGDAYKIGTNLWARSEDGEWIDIGQFQGDRGPRGFPELALTGRAGLASSTLPMAPDGEMGYVEGLGIYKFYQASGSIPDGELVIKPSIGGGRWHMALPSMESTAALVQNLVDTTPETKKTSLTWEPVPAGGSCTQTVAFPGAHAGSPCFINGPFLVSGLVLFAEVSADAVVSVRISNYSSAAITPVAGSYTIKVFNA